MNAENEEEEREEESDDENDEVDPAVEASDIAMIEEVADDVATLARLPPLTRADLNLARFSIFKVHLVFSRNCLTFIHAHDVASYPGQQNCQ